jgi:hypothetical protein
MADSCPNCGSAAKVKGFEAKGDVVACAKCGLAYVPGKDLDAPLAADYAAVPAQPEDRSGHADLLEDEGPADPEAVEAP